MFYFYQVKPLRSAFKEALGTEPDFSNWAFTKNDKEDFIGNLDYIFLSDSWIVDAVSDMPKRDKVR